MRKLIIPFLFFLLVAASVSVSAQGPKPIAPQQWKFPIATSVMEAMDKIRESYGKVQGEVKNIREQNQIQMQTIRDKFSTDMEVLRTQMQQKVKDARAAFQIKLRQIKDEKKRTALGRIADGLNDLNQRLTGQFSETIDKLQEVLSRIVSRADKAASRGLDVSAVRTAIQNAQTILATAHATVQAQAAKTYSINLPDIITTSTISGLRSAVQNVRDALKTDLTATRDAVKAARDAVHEAAVTLAQIPRVNEPAPTSTGAVPPPPSTSTQ